MWTIHFWLCDFALRNLSPCLCWWLTHVIWYFCSKQLVTSILNGSLSSGVASSTGEMDDDAKHNHSVSSFFLLWRPWAGRVFFSCIILLLIPLFVIVEFPVVKPSTICYNCCQLNYSTAMPKCCRQCCLSFFTMQATCMLGSYVGPQ